MENDCERATHVPVDPVQPVRKAQLKVSAKGTVDKLNRQHQNPQIQRSTAHAEYVAWKNDEEGYESLFLLTEKKLQTRHVKKIGRRL